MNDQTISIESVLRWTCPSCKYVNFETRLDLGISGDDELRAPDSVLCKACAAAFNVAQTKD